MLDIPTISGLTTWQTDKVGDMESFYANAEDIHRDVRDCVMDEVLNGGMDLQGVQATIRDEGDGWHTYFTFFVDPLGPAAPVEWVLEIQNSLGVLMINESLELATGGLEPPPTLEVSTVRETGDLKIFDLTIPPLHTTAVSAAEGLRPWFRDLTLRVRAETPSGPACDELTPADMPTMPGLSSWGHEAESGGYEYFYATAEDTYEDVTDCDLGEMLNNGMDLQGVQATISTEGEGWQAFLVFFVADLDPAASKEWVVEIENSVGFLMLNDAFELDSDVPEPPPTLQSFSTFNEIGYDLKVFDLKIPGLYTSPAAAAEGLRPWFTELTMRVRAETPSGPACDEFSPAG